MKKSVSTLLTLSTVLFFLALPLFSYASNGNTCNQITKIVPWPVATSNPMLPMKTRHFEVSVPPNMDNMAFVNDFLVLKYSKEKYFSINPVKKDQIHIRGDSTFGVAEWIKFLFTSECLEVIPQNKADKIVLKSWVNARASYLEEGTLITTSDSGSLRYVHIHESKSSISPDSLFIVDKTKNTAIAIIFEGFDHTEISNIISTIKQRN